MGQAQLQQKQYTVEEYFALEEQSEVRHEFFGGEIFAMAGESVAHNTIAQNFILALRPALRGKNCRVLIEGVRLGVQEKRHYTYPDVMVSCDPQDQHEARTLYHPVLLIEVLSRSTEAYDRGGKFNSYKQLPSLRHYLLVSQKTWLVEWFQLTEHGVWGYSALTEAADAVRIPELNLVLTVAEIYEESGVAPLRIDLSEGED